MADVLHGPPQGHGRQAPEWELADFSYEALLELGTMAVSTGLGKKQLAKYAPRPYDGSGAGEPTCTICLEDMSIGQPSLTIRCGHTFHHVCVVQWLARSNKCPTCRFEIPRCE